MRILLAVVLLLSTFVLIGCSHPTSVVAKPTVTQPAIAQPVVPKHGYELAKTWSEQTMNENISFARLAYQNWDFHEVGADTKARLDALEYEMCVESAQASKHGGDSLGPQTRAKYKCDSRIDAVEDEAKRIEAENKK
jgi:hypothetical protein